MKSRKAFARAFYPGDVRSQIVSFLDGFELPFSDTAILGAVVPHAGWIYSGRVAARVWAQVAAAGPPDTVVLLGAVHRYYYPAGAAVWTAGHWETPIGDVSVNEEVARDLVRELPDMLNDYHGAHEGEHSIEVQVPMIRHLLPETRIVPVAVPPAQDSCVLGREIGAYLSSYQGTISLVASTDLTHYGPGYGMTPAGSGPSAEAWMEENDRRMLSLMESMECESVVPEAALHHNACGAGAVAAAMGAALAMGAHRGIVVEYTTSHREHGQGETFNMAVGYAGVVFVP